MTDIAPATDSYINGLREAVAQSCGPSIAIGTANVAAILARLDAEIALRVAAEESLGWVEANAGEDEIYERIDALARVSFRRYQSSVRGQQVSRYDSIEAHLIDAALMTLQPRIDDEVARAEAFKQESERQVGEKQRMTALWTDARKRELAAEARIAELEQYAKRYRHIREHGDYDILNTRPQQGVVSFFGLCDARIDEQWLDRHLDAAIAQQSGAEGGGA